MKGVRCLGVKVKRVAPVFGSALSAVADSWILNPDSFASACFPPYSSLHYNASRLASSP